MRSSQTLDSLGARAEAADRAGSHGGQEMHPKPAPHSLGSCNSGGFYLHPQGFFPKIWAVLEDFGRGLRLCHGVSIEHSLCCPKPKIPFSSPEPNPELPLPSLGWDFTLKSSAEANLSVFPCTFISSQARACCGCCRGELAPTNIPHTSLELTYPDLQ